MKIIVFIMIFSFTAGASNWIPLSKIESQSVQAYQLEADCLKSGEQCLDVGDEPSIVKEGFVSLANDWGSEQEVESCEGESDCQNRLEVKVCNGLHKFVSEDHTRVYCVELLGKVLVKDLAGWSAHKSAKASAAALESGIAQAQGLRHCGERVMALMLVRNQPKGLSTAQVKQLVNTYAPIKGILESGSLVSAKEEIQAVNADGVLVTEGDKAALVAEINKCLGL